MLHFYTQIVIVNITDFQVFSFAAKHRKDFTNPT